MKSKLRKVVLYIATSIDNYIARKDGSVDWLDATPNPEKLDYGYYSFYKDIDTTLMGNGTFQEVLGFNVPFPYPDKTNYVFSRNSGLKDSNVEFISEDIAGFVADLKQQKGKDIWLVGGGQINTILLNAGLVDEMIITRIPIVLGEGIPMFSGIPKETVLDLKKSEDFNNGIVQMTYVPRNDNK